MNADMATGGLIVLGVLMAAVLLPGIAVIGVGWWENRITSVKDWWNERRDIDHGCVIGPPEGEEEDALATMEKWRALVEDAPGWAKEEAADQVKENEGLEGYPLEHPDGSVSF